ncbi:MAG: O-antigen ligase family protein [Vicingus serpentipes]|nr:O-antigen ligase family protein [Vicingus serpentipes]
MKLYEIFKPRNFFLLGIATMMVGLSMSKPLISLGQIIILLTWLIDGKMKDRVMSFFRNKTAVVLSSIYLLTLFGLFYTSNFDYAVGDVRRKAALFGLPFLISGFQPISTKEWKIIFKVYVAGVLVASFWSMYVYFGGLNKMIIDVREYSRFNSHIRFGLEVCFAIFGSAYYMYLSKSNTEKMIWGIIGLWLIAFLYIISLFTGMIVLVLTTLILLLLFSFISTNLKMRYILFFGLLISIFYGIFSINEIIENYREDKNINQLDKELFSTSGERYYHDVTSTRKEEKENGHYVWRNIAWKELETAWNSKSNLPFRGEDLKHQELSTTLIRFLASKGMIKNGTSVNQLTLEEIAAIEKGIANYHYLYMNNFEKRVHKIIWEYDNYQDKRDFNGHSVIMRWEYWKTGGRIFKQNLWMGVGTGDVQDAFNAQYEKDQSQLLPKYRLRAHNQYITYAVTFGILGILAFAFFLIFPIVNMGLYKDFTYVAFFSIVLLSMFTEDTLETQVGINFFTLFNTILLLKEKNDARN